MYDNGQGRLLGLEEDTDSPSLFPEEDTHFDDMKRKILIDLQLGIDKSIKGFIDDDIADIVAALNRDDDVITTSSCSGRISFFHKDFTKDGLSSASPAATKMKRGQGRGITYSSHEIVPEDDETVLKGYPHDIPSTGILELKMEPLILHAMCRNMKTAQRLVACGVAAGLKRGGIILSKKGHINVAVIGAFGFNSPLLVEGTPIVPRPNVIPLLRHANQMMGVNATRRFRFLKQVESW